MCRKKVQVLFVVVVVVVILVFVLVLVLVLVLVFVAVFVAVFALSLYHVSILSLCPTLYVTYFPCCLLQG
jgi:hypothetical protein